MHRPLLPLGNVPVTHFHQGLSRLQGHDTVGRNVSLKNPVTPPVNDPGAVREEKRYIRKIITNLSSIRILASHLPKTVILRISAFYSRFVGIRIEK